MLIWLMLFGCPRAPDPEQLAYERAGGPPITAPMGRQVDPGPWTDGLGLALTVPEGWVGEGGVADGSLRLTLEHPDTGTRLLVWSFPRTSAPGPRPREGCRRVFEDKGSYRTVPALTPSGVYTCVLSRGTGDTVMTWYGVLGDREVHLEAFLRPGANMQGRRLLDEVFPTVTRGARDGVRQEAP